MQQYTNLHKISLPLAVWLANNEYDFEPSEKSISVTTLMRSVRQTVLTSRLEASGLGNLEDISNLLASRMGTAIHNGVEKAWVENAQECLEAIGVPAKVRNKIVVNPSEVSEGDLPVWLELRTSKEIDGWNILGCADMIMDGSVHDVKSTGTFAYLTGSMNNKYRLQLSMYAWLNPDKITEPMGYIQYIFKDWSKLEASFKSDYPQLPVLQQPIPLLSSMETETYIRNKIKDLNFYWNSPQEDIPLCSPEDLWASKPKYQYRVKADAKKASKNFDTMAEANTWAASKGKGFVTYKAGKAKACNYCAVRDTCNQYLSMKAQGTVD